MSNVQLYKDATNSSLTTINTVSTDKLEENAIIIGSQPLNIYDINDVVEEPNLVNNLLCGFSNSVEITNAINYPITSFTPSLAPPLSLSAPSTVEGRFTNIGGVYRGVIHISELFYNTSGVHAIFTISMSPIKSTNFVMEDQVSGMVSMRGSNTQLRGNIRAVPASTNIMVSIYSNLAVQGVCVLNMIFN